MRRTNIHFTLVSFLLALGLSWVITSRQAGTPAIQEEEGDKMAPNDWFLLQRSYPDPSFDENAYIKAIQEAKRGNAQAKKTSRGFDRDWTLQGPANIGGRINDIAIDPLDKDIMYAGAAAGGIFKTTDGGNSWEPIFDEQAFLAIGSITIDPNDHNVIYAGTGDLNIGGYVAVGNGIYKSSDGGNSWAYTGLAEQRIISKIIVDPADSKIIYAATMGSPFVRNNARGLYKSADGGKTWTQVFLIDNQTGIIDLVMDPSDNKRLYAVGWTRIRTNKESLTTSTKCGIYLSTDGGQNWNMLSNGLPTGKLSRPGIAISKNNPSLLYAMFTDTLEELDGVYKSSNGGSSWSKLGKSGLGLKILGGFGWYFGKIWINPYDDNDIYLAGVDLWRMNVNKGEWKMFGPPWFTYAVHADKHAMQWMNSNELVLGHDGGMNTYAYDKDKWITLDDLPITQFYHVAVNPYNSTLYYGGAQDNGTLKGNKDGLNAWERMYGGDGFKIIFHPTKSNIHYVETQNGNISVYNSGTYGRCDYFPEDTAERRNWDMPYILSSHDPDVLYCGTHKIYKNITGERCKWNPISDDMTRGNLYGFRFHSISALEESPLDAKHLYTGTSDGKVWKTEDGGSTWIDISQSLPNRYVTDIKASAANKDVLYVSHSGYKDNELIPHLHRSDNNGQSWTDISSDLPPTAVNRILEYPANDSILFVATDDGIYGSLNKGMNWERLGNNMPYFPVYDVVYDSANHVLVAGTFARGIMTYPMDSIIAKKKILVNIADAGSMPFGFSIYPNPATDVLNLKIQGAKASPAQVDIFTIKGELVRSVFLRAIAGESQHPLPIADLPEGTYLLRIRQDNSSQTGRLLKM